MERSWRQRKLNAVKTRVTARLLPPRFCFDASDEQLVVNKAVEEVVPFLGCAAGIFERERNEWPTAVLSR
jgi:hypothetical protein